MLDYNLDIEKRSTWILATQPTAAKSMPFYLSEIGRFYAGPRYYTLRSGREGYYLVYTHAGCGCMHIGEKSWELGPGSALLLPCMPLHRYHTEGEAWLHSWMHLDGAGVTAYHTLLDAAPVAATQPRRFEKQFDNLIALAGDIDVAAAARISHGISALLTDLLADSLAVESTGNPSRHTGVEEAIRFIQEHYQSNLSIDQIVKRVNLSKYHFVRLFRRQVGTTPYHYLIHYRINQSKRLLCTTDDSVAEIAQQVGYPSASNYISQFSRLTGMTPVQFRKSNINYLEASGKE